MPQFLVPIISAGLYYLGGQKNKWFRWLLGAGIGLCVWTDWVDYGIAIGSYFIATNVFSYGDNNWTSKLFGRWASMALAGLTMGLASIIYLGVFWGIIQAIVGAVSFTILKYLDDKDILKNPYQELLRGFTGTICYLFH